MVSVNRVQVEAALPGVDTGLDRYLLIQDHVHFCNVSTNREFQRLFNGFYKVRRNGEWRARFFALLERVKSRGISFHDALDELRSATGNIEASFASKLVATIDPSKPVIDEFVLNQFGLSLPYPKAKDRFNRVLCVYECLSDGYAQLLSSPTGLMIIECFGRRFGNKNVTPLKKVDLVLWQIRP
jgi:hypothetical protein